MNETEDEDRLPMSLVLFAMAQEDLDRTIREGVKALVIQYYNFHPDERGLPDSDFMNAVEQLIWYCGVAEHEVMDDIRAVHKEFTARGRTFDPIPEED